MTGTELLEREKQLREKSTEAFKYKQQGEKKTVFLLYELNAVHAGLTWEEAEQIYVHQRNKYYA